MRPSAFASPGGCEMCTEPSGILHQVEAHPLEHGRILLQRGQVFVVDDRRRHVPGRVDGDVLHRLRQERRRRAGLADHDARRPDRRVVVVDAQREVRDVQHHMGLAEIARHPAPALHVGHDDDVVALVALAVEGVDRLLRQPAGRRQALLLLELRDRVGERLVVEQIVAHRRQAEPLAQQRHALVLHQHGLPGALVGGEFEHRTACDLRRARASPFRPRASASFLRSAL